MKLVSSIIGISMSMFMLMSGTIAQAQSASGIGNGVEQGSLGIIGKPLLQGFETKDP